MQFSNRGNNPAIAAGYFFKGLKLLPSKGLRQYLIAPVLINLILYTAALVGGYYYVGDLINHFIPGWLQWLRWILWPLFFLSFFIAGFFSFTLLANLIAAPFYGKLAAKTLAVVTGQNTPINEPPIAKVIWSELNRAGYFVLLALPLIVLSIIPGVNLLAPVLWGLFGAWGMALEYMAYPMENAGILFADQKRLLRSIKLGSLSFGGLAAAALTLPVFNIFVAPATVIGATIYFNDISRASR